MANRLRNETSPYLLQHAENPVDWYPWGETALQRAKDEHKPIFLSIGYAACHWCHVMAHESFEDPDIAAIMNEHFINIKVDREERPEIDSIYMDAVVAMTGQGGWPMSVFMTPEGKPFYGGTYFPPERRYQMPSFQEVLSRIAQLWEQDRESLLESADKITGHISGRSKLPPSEAELNLDLLDQATERMFRTYDWSDGGWGGAPKFPQATSIEFLLMRHVLQDDPLALEMSTHALAEMAAGGIYDHLGGGFHRYSVDEHWLVPHFEKMLYDTALLTRAYLHAWRVSGAADLRRVVEESLGFLVREMRHPEGGFFSSLDADSEGEEGKYYVWSEAEIREILAADGSAEIFLTAYGVTELGNFEGANILHRALDDRELAEGFDLPVERVREQIAAARERLLETRNQRVRPALDDKVLTSWNGLLLISLSEAARMLDRPDYLDTAQDLARFLVEESVHEGELRRSWRRGRTRYRAYLEDHAAMGLGLLALYECDQNPRWYQAAQERAEEIIAHFRDGDGGFYDTRDDHEALIARPRSLQDSPVPSSNTLATWLLMRMSSFSGDHRYSEYAEAAVGSMSENAARQPTAFSGWLISMLLLLNPNLQLAILGDPAEEDFQLLHAAVKSRYIPNLVVAGGRPEVASAPALLIDRTTRGGKATAYLCRSFSCKRPTTSPEQLEEQLEETL